MKFYFDGILVRNEMLSEPIEFKSESLIEVNEIVDLLNADLSDSNGIIWNGNDVKTLQEIVPKKRTYGWMQISVSKPFYIRLEAESDLSNYEHIRYDGFVSSSLELIKKLAKNYNG